MRVLQLLTTALLLAATLLINALNAQQPDSDSDALRLLLLREDLRDLGSQRDIRTSTIDDAARQRIVLGAQQQEPESQYLLAMLRLYGQGVEKDPRAAVQLLRRAADQKHRDAEFALGVLYASDSSVVPRSDRASAAWLTKSASRGHVDAQWMLAVLLNEGRGVDENVPRALALFNAAARAGSAHAQFHLGVMHEYGRGVTPNASRAAELYEHASASATPVPDAIYFLALLYAQGRGRHQSFAHALMLFERAAERFQHAQAMVALGHMHARGQGVAVDYARARVWFDRAAQRNDPRASDNAAHALAELDAFLANVETHVRTVETALGTPLRVTVASIE